jgi:hypothetical protein
MSVVEYLVTVLAVAGALFYLGRRWWRKFRSGGCCGASCPVASSKIRLAAPERRASTELR